VAVLASIAVRPASDSNKEHPTQKGEPHDSRQEYPQYRHVVGESRDGGRGRGRTEVRHMDAVRLPKLPPVVKEK
jgi:hypothetical protein